MRIYKKVIRDRKGKLSIESKFLNRGCYLYFIPKKFLNKIEEGKIYLFKFGPPKWSHKRDRKGKKIYICAAIPVMYKQYSKKSLNKEMLELRLTPFPETKFIVVNTPR